ncbi:Kinesin-like protein kif21a, partial [Conglomerata obtusa]
MPQPSKVRVEIRIKPTPDDVLDITPPHRISLAQKMFTFDHVHDSLTTHKDIFDLTIRGLADSFMKSFNCTVFAYGQTGSGKTHSMGISVEALEAFEMYVAMEGSDQLFEKEISGQNNYKQVVDLENENVTNIQNKSNRNDIDNGYRNSCSINSFDETVINYEQNFLGDNIKQRVGLSIFKNKNKIYNEADFGTNKFDSNYVNGHITNNNIINIVRNKFNNKDTMNMHEDQNTGSSNQYFGIVPDSINYIFKNKNENDKIYCSLIEVYNEEVIDLLSDFRTVLTLRQINGETNISGSQEIYLNNIHETITILKKGLLERTVKSTKMNSLSSRSHAIFTLSLHKIKNGNDTISKFTFVDLAGSERMKRTGAQGTTAKESISINGGLLALSNVITALSKKSLFIPYRDSKLTRILQHGLGGNSHTLMLANISGSSKDINETFNTLKYATRATNICNDVKKGIEIDMGRMSVIGLKKEIMRYKGENAELKNRLKGKSKNFEEEKMIDLANENSKLREEIRKIKVVSDKSSKTTTENISLRKEFENKINVHLEQIKNFKGEIKKLNDELKNYQNFNLENQIIKKELEEYKNELNKNKYIYNENIILKERCERMKDELDKHYQLINENCILKEQNERLKLTSDKINQYVCENNTLNFENQRLKEIIGKINTNESMSINIDKLFENNIEKLRVKTDTNKEINLDYKNAIQRDENSELKNNHEINENTYSINNSIQNKNIKLQQDTLNYDSINKNENTCKAFDNQIVEEKKLQNENKNFILKNGVLANELNFTSPHAKTSKHINDTEFSIDHEDLILSEKNENNYDGCYDNYISHKENYTNNSEMHRTSDEIKENNIKDNEYFEVSCNARLPKQKNCTLIDTNFKASTNQEHDCYVQELNKENRTLNIHEGKNDMTSFKGLTEAASHDQNNIQNLCDKNIITNTDNNSCLSQNDVNNNIRKINENFLNVKQNKHFNFYINNEENVRLNALGMDKHIKSNNSKNINFNDSFELRTANKNLRMPITPIKKFEKREIKTEDLKRKKRMVTFNLDKNEYIEDKHKGRFFSNAIFGNKNLNTNSYNDESDISFSSVNEEINKTIIDVIKIIGLDEPFIYSVANINNLLYSSTLNGKVYEINYETNDKRILVTEEDEIKRIFYYESNIFYVFKNCVKKIGDANSFVLQVDHLITCIHTKREFLIIGTEIGFIYIYNIKDDFKCIFSQKIHSTIILSIQNVIEEYTEKQRDEGLNNLIGIKPNIDGYDNLMHSNDIEYNKSNNLNGNLFNKLKNDFKNEVLYIGSKDYKIAYLSKEQIGYLEDTNYSATECLLALNNILISCGRDGCIKIYKEKKLLITHLKAHSGSIKSACVVNNGFCTGGKDGVLKYWIIIDDVIKEKGRIILDGCINCLVYDASKEILFAACM